MFVIGGAEHSSLTESQGLRVSQVFHNQSAIADQILYAYYFFFARFIASSTGKRALLQLSLKNLGMVSLNWLIRKLLHALVKCLINAIPLVGRNK